MSMVGGVPEQKDIGLSISLDGTHNNTEYDIVTNCLRLKAIEKDANGLDIYPDKGSWTSAVINLKDKFADFGKVFTTNKAKSNTDNSSIAILTRVSDDGIVWSNWIAVATDGTIQSDTKQFIQVRIDFFAGFETDVYLISDFNNADDAKLFDSELIDTSNGLRLKRNHNLNMTVDSSWTGGGSLHRKPIKREDWIRIDKMNVSRKEYV